MSQYRFLQLDVFTDHAFSGNPLAVFPEAVGLSDEVMLKIAREMNLSETVFVLESDNAEVLRRLRIFTPTRGFPSPVIQWSARGTRWRAKVSFRCPVAATVGNASIMKLESECFRSRSSSKTDSRSRS